LTKDDVYFWKSYSRLVVLWIRGASVSRIVHGKVTARGRKTRSLVANRALVRRLLEEAFNTKRMDTVDELVGSTISTPRIHPNGQQVVKV